MSRPEHTAPPEVFYNDDEAKKYTFNTRIIDIQNQLTERALELLALDPSRPSLLLDIGCGSGLSGEVLSENGHVWVGVDISRSMLNIGVEREVDGDTIESDIGQGLPFRSGMFDGAISISAIQWLCNADKTSHNPWKRLNTFFKSLFASLSRGSKAVLQFYPENAQQMEMITTAAMRCGFTGGLLVDFPHSTKAKKYFLVLFSGAAANFTMPQALGTDEAALQNQIAYADEPSSASSHRKGKGRRTAVKSKDWVKEKKERQRRQGRDVRPDSKYTGRKRGPKF
jgi:18S rRNA (guanine1575-N7)-methyltransferase